APQFNRYQAFGTNPVTSIDPAGTTEMPDWASYLLMGITAAIAVISVIATWGASTAALGIAIAGAAFDLASTALETAALATGRTQIDDPLNIAALTFGGLGIITGVLSGVADGVLALGARSLARAGSTAAAKEMNDFSAGPRLLGGGRKGLKTVTPDFGVHMELPGTSAAQKAAVSVKQSTDWKASFNAVAEYRASLDSAGDGMCGYTNNSLILALREGEFYAPLKNADGFDPDINHVLFGEAVVYGHGSSYMLEEMERKTVRKIVNGKRVKVPEFGYGAIFKISEAGGVHATTLLKLDRYYYLDAERGLLEVFSRGGAAFDNLENAENLLYYAGQIHHRLLSDG
ncbi:hypothetical protein, partial [Streptomyces sp. NPDC001774]